MRAIFNVPVTAGFVFGLTVVCLLASCVPLPAAAPEQQQQQQTITAEMARAQAQAAVVIAKAVAATPAPSPECKLAEFRAGEAIIVAKLLNKSKATKQTTGPACNCPAGGACAACECVDGVCPAPQSLTVAPKLVPAKQTPAKTSGNLATLSADGRVLTCADGKVLVRHVDGTYREPSTASAAPTCQVINGKTVCK